MFGQSVDYINMWHLPPLADPDIINYHQTEAN